MGAVDAVDFGFDVGWDDVAFDFSWRLKVVRCGVLGAFIAKFRDRFF
jgi:hypothetical protein